MVIFGEAAAHEAGAIVELLHDDPIGAARESTSSADLERYRAAFYEQPGFVASHEGMKLQLETGG